MASASTPPTSSHGFRYCDDLRRRFAIPWRSDLHVDLLDELMMHHVKIRRFRIDQRAINHVSLPFEPWLT